MSDFERGIERESQELIQAVVAEADAYWDQFESYDEIEETEIPAHYLGNYFKWAEDIRLAKIRSATPEQRVIVFERDNGECHYCHVDLKGKYFEIDHVIPFSRCKETEVDNLVCACRDCNMAKYTTDYDTFVKNLNEYGLEWRDRVARYKAELRAYRYGS